MSLQLVAGPTSLERLETAIGRMLQKHGFFRVKMVCLGPFERHAGPMSRLAPHAGQFPAGRLGNQPLGLERILGLLFLFG